MICFSSRATGIRRGMSQFGGLLDRTLVDVHHLDDSQEVRGFWHKVEGYEDETRYGIP